MRLVDIDKFNKLYFSSYDCSDRVGLLERCTVKAVPVEWIEEWQNRHEWEYDSYFTMRDGKPKYAIECMIEDWVKENG